MRKLTKKSLYKLAKTMPVIEEKSLKEFIGGGNGTSANPYSQAQLDFMTNNGTWNGGYVDNYGYVGNDAFVIGNSAYPGGTDQTYYSFPDYITSLTSSGFEKMMKDLVESLPVAGNMVANVSHEYENMTRDIQRELLVNGYGGSSSFAIVRTSQWDSTIFSVYDANTGRLITSRTMDSYGSWH